jgi:hypothetical protein
MEAQGPELDATGYTLARHSTGETGCCGASIWHDDVSGYCSIQGKVRYVDWAAYARLQPRTAEDT